jgi:hypothetical protein
MLPVAPTNDVGVLITILAMRYIPYHLHCRSLLIEVGNQHQRRNPTNQLFGWSSSGRSNSERVSILRFSIIEYYRKWVTRQKCSAFAASRSAIARWSLHLPAHKLQCAPEASHPSLAPFHLFQFLLDTHLRESK